MDNNQDGNKAPTAFLVDLVSNRKIPIATPRCRVGRDDLNDIVISGDQSISRFHFIISYENSEFTVQDAKSRHGTFLNGNQLTVSEPIKDGDVLKVGVSLFWFVVEGAQSESADPASPNRVSAITEDEKAAAADAKVAFKAGSEMMETTTMPSLRSQEMTQEMQRPDPALMDKLEQAANSIKMEEKPEPKASLASLLADARANEPPEPDKKKEELAALAARDKELLTQIDDEAARKVEEAAAVGDKFAAEEEQPEPAETVKGEFEPTDSAEDDLPESADLKEEDLPVRPINKPSDTVTLEALTHPAPQTVPAPAAVSTAEAVPESAAVSTASALPEAPPKAESETEEDEEIVTSTQLTSLDSAASSKDEPQTSYGVEEAESEFVSKGANSDTKAANAGIIESFDKSSAKGEESFSPDMEAVVSAEKEDSASIQVDPVPSAGKEIVAPFLPGSFTGSESGGESGPNGAGSGKSKGERAEDISQAEIGQTIKVSSGSQDLEVTKFIKAGASAVPDWCKRYFSDEIAKLNNELDELNEQVKIAQQKIRDVETRVALTRGIRNTLLTTTGDELVEACGKVLSLLGWKVTISSEDKHELRLEVEDKHICIARVIWTTTKAERSHLGQLSISQTRYWMEKGIEPKGIIIVSKISSDAPTAVGDSPEEIELNDYAAKRNVCLMSTLQLLSLYKEIALSDASPDKLRTSIVNASGWLAGHNLEPGTSDVNEDEGSSNSASGKVSSLASA